MQIISSISFKKGRSFRFGANHTLRQRTTLHLEVRLAQGKQAQVEGKFQLYVDVDEFVPSIFANFRLVLSVYMNVGLRLQANKI